MADMPITNERQVIDSAEAAVGIATDQAVRRWPLWRLLCHLLAHTLLTSAARTPFSDKV